jgi:hypothetical protein
VGEKSFFLFFLFFFLFLFSLGPGGGYERAGAVSRGDGQDYDWDICGEVCAV